MRCIDDHPTPCIPPGIAEIDQSTMSNLPARRHLAARVHKACLRWLLEGMWHKAE